MKSVDTKVVLDTTTQMVKIAKTERDSKDDATRTAMTMAAKHLGERTVILLNFVRYIRGELHVDPLMVQEEMKLHSEGLFAAVDGLEHSLLKGKVEAGLALPRKEGANFGGVTEAASANNSNNKDDSDWDEVWNRRRTQGGESVKTLSGSGGKFGAAISPQSREWLQTLERVLASDNYEAVTKAVKDIIGIYFTICIVCILVYNCFSYK